MYEFLYLNLLYNFYVIKFLLYEKYGMLRLQEIMSLKINEFKMY